MSDPPGQEPTQPIPIEPTTPEPDPTHPPTTPPKTFDESYVKELRAEAAKNRKANKELQTKLDKISQTQEAQEAAKLAEQGEFQKLADNARQEADQLRLDLTAQAQQLANERRTRQASTIAAQMGVNHLDDANITAAIDNVDMSGDDPEAEIKKRLETLKERRPDLFQGKGAPELASFNPSGQPQAPPRETDAQRRLRISGGNNQFFDEQAAAASGGGVVWPKGKPE